MAADWKLIGHEWAVRLLSGQINSNNLRHAYLFLGPDGVGRRTLALRFAQALNCTQPSSLGEFCSDCRTCRGIARMQHEDLFVIARQEGDREIKIDALREMSRALALSPYDAKHQIALLLDFENASEEAANALLKTLEEPNPSVVLILTAQESDSLPATVVSRCEVLRLRPIQFDQVAVGLSDQFGLSQEEAILLASISDGRPGIAIQMIQEPRYLAQRQRWLEEGLRLLSSNRVERFAYADKMSKDREELRDLLLVWLSLWRDALKGSTQVNVHFTNSDFKAHIDQLINQFSFRMIYEMVHLVETTLEKLKTNVNTRLLTEMLLLQMPSL
ncbi:MAG: ATP-binding protein [Anaerolineales bacterium]